MQPNILLCAGEELLPRWGKFLGVPRHLVPAGGEPLIHRTQRQLLERGFTDIAVMCDPSRADKYVLDTRVRTAPPPQRSSDIRNNSTVWAYRQVLAPERTNIILFADTYYTDAFMDSLAANIHREFLIYGRSHRVKPHHSSSLESFAIILTPAGVKKYLAHLEQAVPQATSLAARALRAAAGLTALMYTDMKKRTWPQVDEWWVEWKDDTEDIDMPDDWTRLHRHFPQIFTRPCAT